MFHGTTNCDDDKSPVVPKAHTPTVEVAVPMETIPDIVPPTIPATTFHPEPDVWESPQELQGLSESKRA